MNHPGERSPHDTTLREMTADAAAEFSAADIEAAYLRALEAVDAVEQAIPELAAQRPVDQEAGGLLDSGDIPHERLQDISALGPPSGAPPDLLNMGRDERLLRPEQVVEAALFVGGEPLSSQRLSQLLGQEPGRETVAEIIERLNEQYGSEHRPYEIRFAQGGFELTLRPEFELVRDRVYGRSPKEVKLSLEALEVLALVAFRQPVSCREIEDAGKTNAATVLRQLLRRQLVRLDRSGDGTGEVTYSTTPRFLELFGLRSLDDLPLPEDFALK